MAKMTMDQFKREASDAASIEESRRERDRRAYFERKVAAARTGPAGISALLNVALLDSRLDGVPSRIHLAAPNGYMDGTYLVRRHGVWGIELKESLGGDQFHQSPMTGIDLADKVLKALRISHSPAAFRRMADLMAWPFDDLRPFLNEVGRKVPLDVMRASIGHLGVILTANRAPYDRRGEALRHWVAHVHGELGGELSLPLAEREASPASVAASAGNVETLAAMKAAGVDVDRPMPPGHPNAGLTPLAYALAHGQLATAIVLLDRLGASPVLRPNPVGETMLHLLAQGVLLHQTHPEVEEARILAARIAGAGVDPDGRDCHGRTAAAIVRDTLDDPNPSVELDRYAKEGLAAILAILEEPLASARSPVP